MMYVLHNKVVQIVLCGAVIIMAGCTNATPLPTLAPTMTPATLAERRDAFYDELRINLARLKRDINRIEQDKAQDIQLVYMSGLSIDLTYKSLEEMKLISQADKEALGIQLDIVAAHHSLLRALTPCRALGARAFLEEPIASIMEAYEECRSRVQSLEEQNPELFVCPNENILCAS